MPAAAIYLDANATTPVLPEVVEAMQPYWTDHFGNPASPHRFGQKARQALEHARQTVADLLDAEPEEVVFTSGATEANQLALFGLLPTRPATLLASAIEHPSVWEPVQQCLTIGHALQTMAVSEEGIVQLPEERDLDRIGLAALMLANHETGAIQPVQALAQRLGNVPLHVDATQALGKLPISFRQSGAATLSGSAHKFHGPKGVGLLLVRRGTSLKPRIFGGHQQHGLRPGTEAVPLAVGLAAALRRAVEQAAQRTAHLTRLRHLLLETLRPDAEPLFVNGPLDGGLAHVLHLSFPGCRSESLLMRLDLEGVACSAGSACSSGSMLPSPVLQAMRLPPERLTSAVRFSLHCLLSEDEVREAGRRIARTVRALRSVSTSTSAVEAGWPP